jgi:hypothetical protein
VSVVAMQWPKSAERLVLGTVSCAVFRPRRITRGASGKVAVLEFPAGFDLYARSIGVGACRHVRRCGRP